MHTSSHTFRTLTITLNHALNPSRIGAYRKYLNALAPAPEQLMHNHHPETGRAVRQPALIHYRVKKGRAVLYGMNEGIAALRRFLDSTAGDAGGSLWHDVVDQRQQEWTLQFPGTPKTYRLYDWLPFDRSDNYDAWQSGCAGMQERCALLERILRNHLVGFCQNVGWQPEDEITASLQLIYKMTDVTLHGNPFLKFNIKYTSNLLLPPGIALGKGVSHGYGVQYPYAPARRNDKTQRPVSREADHRSAQAEPRQTQPSRQAQVAAPAEEHAFHHNGGTEGHEDL